MKYLIALLTLAVQPAIAADWKYSSTTDPMTDKGMQSATLKADGRKHESLVVINDGPASLMGFDGVVDCVIDCRIEMRINGGEVLRVPARPTRRVPPKLVVFDIPRDVQEALKKGEKIRVRVPMLDRPAEVLDFSPSPLAWPQ